MKITRDKSNEDWAIDEVILNWGKEAREGIHLSDLLSPRKAYWQRVLPKNPTIDEILYWTSGSAIEDKFLRAIRYEKGKTKEWNGILYTPDIFFNFPAEIKSRRRTLAKEGEEKSTYDLYLKQLGGYCAAEDKQLGWLIVISLLEKQEGTHKTKPELAIYRAEWEKTELVEKREWLLKAKDQLLEALKDKKLGYLSLPLCESWMCGSEKRNVIEPTMCLDCKKKLTKNNRFKHKDHKIQEAKIEIIFEPRCKWYQECIESQKNL